MTYPIYLTRDLIYSQFHGHVSEGAIQRPAGSMCSLSHVIACLADVCVHPQGAGATGLLGGGRDVWLGIA